MDIRYLFILFIAATIHACWNFMLKSTSNKAIVLWLGQAIGGILFLPLAFILSSLNHREINWLYLVSISGMLHAMALYFLAKAYEHGELSSVLPISRGTAILGTALFSCCILGEQIRLQGALGIIITLLGVFGLNSYIPTQQGNIVANAKIAIMTGMMIAVYSLFDQYAVSRVPPLYFVAGSSLATALFWAPSIFKKHGHEFFKLAKDKKSIATLVGLGGLTSYCIILFVLKNNSVVYVLSASQISIVIGVLLGICFLREKFSVNKLIYVSCIILGIFLTKIN